MTLGAMCALVICDVLRYLVTRDALKTDTEESFVITVVLRKWRSGLVVTPRKSGIPCSLWIKKHTARPSLSQIASRSFLRFGCVSPSKCGQDEGRCAFEIAARFFGGIVTQMCSWLIAGVEGD